MRALFREMAIEVPRVVESDPEDIGRMCAVRGVELPHPIPYQGSKRLLAPRILSYVAGRRFRRLYEPFAGSAAITIAAAHRRLAESYVIGDSLEPLAALWQSIIAEPIEIADRYERVWSGHVDGSIEHYNRVRDAFNRHHEPAHLLYLLARCVKNAPRFNGDGGFNQSADKRRLGMQPRKMRREIVGASLLLRHRARAEAADFGDTLRDATDQDLVYMDPPYQGATTGPHKRYHQGMERGRLITALEDLNRRGVPWILSYDGRSGERRYGEYLPAHLDAERIEIDAGRSSQATLNGRDETTIESLYVSCSLLKTRRPTARDAAAR